LLVKITFLTCFTFARKLLVHFNVKATKNNVLFCPFKVAPERKGKVVNSASIVYCIYSKHAHLKITIYAPMIYTAPCVMFYVFDGADTLRGQVGGSWAREMESFLVPVKWHRADRRVPFVAQKTLSVFFHAPPTLLKKSAK
jgi:hypothetical protein